MNAKPATCPVCLSKDGYPCTKIPFPGDASLFNCDVCGEFAVSGSALEDYSDLRLPDMPAARRAALSHRIRLFNSRESNPSLWTSDGLREFINSEPVLPTPSQQAVNIIRYIGQEIEKTGEPFGVPPADFHATVGSPNRAFSFSILHELQERGVITAAFLPDGSSAGHVQDISLTLDGWDLYEKEKGGKVSGSYGFVALKFNDPTLDPLLKDKIKPAIQEIGYELIDMRDVAEAGIIDNLMRIQIRDAAFILVDLTHENAGAYWEAGFAEGLGKPVLYICEKSKFEDTQTHFDTNHCTTVLWSEDGIDSFLEELNATLRRSLNI